MRIRRFTTLAATAALIGTLVAVLPTTPGTADVSIPHWTINAPTTQQDSLTVADGVLQLTGSTGGASSGTASPAAAATASTSGAPDPVGEWPTGNRDRARTGNAAWEEFISVPLGAKWTVAANDKIQVNPAIVDDVAYYGGAGADRTMYAVDLQTGNLKWTHTIPGSILSSPTVDSGWVYFGGADGRVYRMATTDGALSWSYPAQGSNPVGAFIGSIAIHNGTIYAGSRDGNLYAIDAATGALQWSVPTPKAISAAATIADGMVFVASGANEYLTAFSETSHAQLWQRAFYSWTDPNTLGTAPSVSSSSVFLTGLDSNLHILDEATGTDIATPSLGSWAQNTPVPAANAVFVGTNNGHVLAFDRGGSPLWNVIVNPNGGIVTSPIFAAGNLFASSTDGNLYGIDTNTHAVTWQYNTGGSLFAPPAIVSNHLLLGSDDHNIYGLMPGVPDNHSYFPPPPVAHTLGIRITIQYSWDPVSTSTGGYTYQATDLSIPGRGIPVGFSRTYNSLDAATNGPLGYGWTFNANPSLTTGTGTVTVRWGDGHQDVYTGTGPFTPPPDVHDALTTITGGYDIATPTHVHYQFDNTGKLTSILDPSGNQTAASYDTNGRLATLTDSSSHTVTFGYDASNRINSVSDPLNRSWNYTYDPAGNLATAADNALHTWRYDYDTAHHLTAITDPDNHLVIRNTYDASGRVTDQLDSTLAHWHYTYNSGNTVVTDPLGHPTTYAYDADYRTTAMTDALGHTNTWVYDDKSNLVATADPTGVTRRFAYDSNGNMTAALDPAGHKTAYAYDASNNLTSITNLKGDTATLAYDSANRLTDSTTPAGVTTHLSYRSDGLVDTVTDGAGGVTQYSYTANGMPAGSTDANHHTTSVTFDADGELTAVTDALIHTTSFHYDTAGRLDQITDPLNHLSHYGYDNTGRRTSFTDANNHTAMYGYDSRGLATSETDALNRTTIVGYDAARRLASRTDARGQTVSYGYDIADRLTSITGPGLPPVTFTVDDAGRPLTMVDGTGTTTYNDDQFGRLVSEHRDLANVTLGYQYDMLGRRSELTLTRDGGLTAHNLYAYDADSRISALTDSAGGTTRFQYDTAGRLASLQYPNAVITSYVYDPAGQVTDVAAARQATTGSATPLSDWHYTYDAVGQRTGTSRVVEGISIVQTYGYDLAGRLTAATSTDPQAPPTANATYGYDNAGNRTSLTVGAVTTSYTYDNADQLTTDGAVDYNWDADGNLVARRPHGLPTAIATYTWDAANRITSQTAGTTQTSYQYDGLGRRVTRSGASGTTTDIYDGNDTVEQLSTGANADTVETAIGGTVLNRIAAGGTAYLHADGNANIGELTDAGGQVTARYAYDPWGNHTTSGTDPTLNNHTYSGAAGVRDDAAGLLDMRNRMYDPSTATFTSRDPLAASSHANYTYASGNPISLVDPNGLESEQGGGYDVCWRDFACQNARDTAHPGSIINCSALFGCTEYRDGAALPCDSRGDCGYGPESRYMVSPEPQDPSVGGYFTVGIHGCAWIVPVCAGVGVNVSGDGVHPYVGGGAGVGGGVDYGYRTGEPHSGISGDVGCSYGPVGGGYSTDDGPYIGVNGPNHEFNAEAQCSAMIVVSG